MTKSSGRPATFEDLDAYVRSGARLGAFSVSEFQDDPELLRAYADFIHAALNAGHIVSGGEVTAFVTEVEREEKLARAQRNWDSQERQYVAWVNDGVVPVYKASIEQWAKAEGLPVPEQVSA